MVLADRVSERAVADRRFGNSLLVRQINMQASLCSGKYECIIHKQKVEATKDASPSGTLHPSASGDAS